MIDNNDFDVLKRKSKDYYTLIKTSKAQLPKRKVFWLPHKLSFEQYIKAFEYKVFNSILFTYTKLFKISYISEDKCSFCKSEPDTPHHLLFHYSLVQLFWKDFEYFFYLLTREFIHLTLQDVMIGII